MRLLALALVLSTVCGFAAFFWKSADEEFDSYTGVSVGMTLARAHVVLKQEGWVRLPSRTRGHRNAVYHCGEGDASHWTDANNLGYSLVLYTDDDCELTKIVRRTGSIEL